MTVEEAVSYALELAPTLSATLAAGHRGLIAAVLRRT